MASVNSILYLVSKSAVGSISIASHVSCEQTRAQTEQPIHSLKRICTGGIGVPYLSGGRGRMQSTGQKGTQA